MSLTAAADPGTLARLDLAMRREYAESWNPAGLEVEPTCPAEKFFLLLCNAARRHHRERASARLGAKLTFREQGAERISMTIPKFERWGIDIAEPRSACPSG